MNEEDLRTTHRVFTTALGEMGCDSLMWKARRWSPEKVRSVLKGKS